MTRLKLELLSSTERRLDEELHVLQKQTGIEYELKVEWLPDTVKHDNGRKLAEEVIGNTIVIYASDQRKAIELIRHGFAEWILNQHARPYRRLINKLITLFEEQQYRNKEEIVEALSKLLCP